MTGNGHQLFGGYAAIAAYPLAVTYGLTGYLLAIGILLGAKAPDYLECRFRSGRRIIPHRTVTHYVPLWVVLLAFSLGGTGLGPAQGVFTLGPVPSEILAGYAIGGLVHLLLDIPNPMGIPILLPHKRISLNLWRSGQAEWLLHLAAVPALAVHLYFQYL